MGTDPENTEDDGIEQPQAISIDRMILPTCP